MKQQTGGGQNPMPKEKSKIQEFFIFVRDLCIVMVLGVGLAFGGYYIGKNNGRNQALAQLNSVKKTDSASGKPSTQGHTEKVQ